MLGDEDLRLQSRSSAYTSASVSLFFMMAKSLFLDLMTEDHNRTDKGSDIYAKRSEDQSR